MVLDGVDKVDDNLGLSNGLGHEMLLGCGSELGLVDSSAVLVTPRLLSHGAAQKVAVESEGRRSLQLVQRLVFSQRLERKCVEIHGLSGSHRGLRLVELLLFFEHFSLLVGPFFFLQQSSSRCGSLRLSGTASVGRRGAGGLAGGFGGFGRRHDFFRGMLRVVYGLVCLSLVDLHYARRCTTRVKLQHVMWKFNGGMVEEMVLVAVVMVKFEQKSF